MCSTVRQRTPRHSSRTVLPSQRHHHRQRIGPLLMAPTKKKQLKRDYFDQTKVASYGGADALRRVTHVPRKIVEEWLSEQDVYTLHKPARRHFRRRRVVVGGPRKQWQTDLVDLSNLKNDNDGMTFLLTVIDVFTKVAWCVPLKNKSALSLAAALKSTFTNGCPQTLQTDQGVEFSNRTVQALLKKNGIHHLSTHNAETKASIVERFNRTYKTRMWRYFTKHQTWRYIDVLQDLVQSYNNSPHRSIGMAPSQVSAKNQEDVWQRMYGHDGKGVPKFRVYRIACASISSRDCSKKATWRIGAKKRYSRYTRFIPPIHSESVLQRRKVGIRTEALVKWYG